MTMTVNLTTSFTRFMTMKIFIKIIPCFITLIRSILKMTFLHNRKYKDNNNKQSLLKEEYNHLLVISQIRKKFIPDDRIQKRKKLKYRSTEKNKN